ncbi:MAG: FtsW/RodA/SpoVE family cell cycle protein [Bacteroidaceae bacterium]|nr:FtsW/RodA/SpoVE family cell cycle protein [Bacteroidaceae bacterium]
MRVNNKQLSIGKIFDGDTSLWVLLLGFCIISILEVYSASSNMTFNNHAAFWRPIMQHAGYWVMGMVVAWACSRIPNRYYGWIVLLGVPLSFMLLVAALFTKGENDGARWISILGFSVQPSEIAKGVLIVVVSWLLGAMRDERGATKRAFYWILGLTVCTCALIAPENLSTAGIVFFVVMLLMFVGKVPHKEYGILLGVLIISASSAYSFLKFTPKPVIEQIAELPMLHRVETWAGRVQNTVAFPEDPDSFDLNTNPQITQSRIAISTCNIIGRGPGNSTVREDLPQAYSDFIFPIIVEEMGIEGAFVVICMYIILLYRAAKLARRCDNNFPAYIMMGLALLITIQACVNMLVAVGIFPITGQPLPLISRGGSSMMMNCAYIGMMISISRTAQHESASNTDSTDE